MNYANRELAEAVQLEPKPRLIPIRWADIHLMPKREALIEGLLDRTAMSIVFGASGAGGGKKATRLQPTARAGLQKLHECLAEHGRPALANGRIPPGSQTVTLSEWKDLLLKAGILNAEGNPREQFRRIHVTLINAGAVGVWEGNVWAVT